MDLWFWVFFVNMICVMYIARVCWRCTFDDRGEHIHVEPLSIEEKIMKNEKHILDKLGAPKGSQIVSINMIDE